MRNTTGHIGQIRAAFITAIGVAVLGMAVESHAQSPWRPDKAVEIVASSGPGGSTDRTARTIQKIMQDQKLLPVPVTVVNRAGGNQTIARAYVLQQAGDAHYFDIANPTLISNHITGVSPQHYSDFTPIALLLNEYTVFTVRADSPIRTARDLAEQLRKDPDAVSVGITTRGGANHLTLSLAARAAGADLKRLKVVSFKSNAESISALLGGHLQMVASSVTPVIGQVSAGKARIIAVGSPQRREGDLAQVPTLREQGIDVTWSNWRAIIGPKGLNAAQVAYWEDVLSKVVATEDWKGSLGKQYWEGNFLRHGDFLKYLAAEYDQTKAIMTELGLAKVN
jgi:putative tricarboxylic transport membrane protein